MRAPKAAAVLIAAVGTIGLGLAGCDDGPSPSELESQSLKNAAQLCDGHGGVGYLNLHGYGYIDELRCNNGAMVEQ